MTVRKYLHPTQSQSGLGNGYGPFGTVPQTPIEPQVYHFIFGVKLLFSESFHGFKSQPLFFIFRQYFRAPRLRTLQIRRPC